MAIGPGAPNEPAHAPGASGGPSLSSRKAQAAQTEAALKAAARAEFTRLGYLNTKITDITTAARRSAGSFYKHFASKEALLESLVGDLQASVDERMAAHTGEHDLSDPRTLRQHVAAFWSTFHQHLPEIVALSQASMVDPAFAARLSTLFEPDHRILVEHLELLQRNGIQLPGRPDPLARMMSGTMFQFAYSLLSADDDVPADEAVDLLTAFILRGIAGTPPA